MKRTVRLITCNESFQAHLIKGALENEGIPAVLHNDNTSNVLRGYAPEIAGVDVFVYEEQYQQAMELLDRNQMLPEHLKYCPNCHSLNLRFALKKRHRFRAICSALLAALAVAPPGTEHWEYVCNDCGAHFDKPVAQGSKP